MITINEYRRRYFMETLSECFTELHRQVCCENTLESLSSYESKRQGTKAFFKSELGMDKRTINQVKEEILKECTYFTKCLVEKVEELADDKMEEAKDNKELPLPENPEMGEEDKEVIKAVFDSKTPEDDIAVIKHATATALFAENKKAEEMKEALDLIQSDDKQNIQETVNRLGKVGPTSLFNSIMSVVTENVVRNQLNENNQNIPTIIKRYSQDIKDDACYIYSLYETMNCFGFKTYSPKQVERLARDMYINS